MFPALESNKNGDSNIHGRNKSRSRRFQGTLMALAQHFGQGAAVHVNHRGQMSWINARKAVDNPTFDKSDFPSEDYCMGAPEIYLGILLGRINQALHPDKFFAEVDRKITQPVGTHGLPLIKLSVVNTKSFFSPWESDF